MPQFGARVLPYLLIDIFLFSKGIHYQGLCLGSSGNLKTTHPLLVECWWLRHEHWWNAKSDAVCPLYHHFPLLGCENSQAHRLPLFPSISLCFSCCWANNNANTFTSFETLHLVTIPFLNIQLCDPQLYINFCWITSFQIFQLHNYLYFLSSQTNKTTFL